MGHEITYCVRCATRIAGTDYERAKAFRLGGRAICAACLPELLPTLTPAEQQELSLSSTKMRAVREQAQARGGSSFRLAPAPRHDAPPPSSRTPTVAGISVAVLALIAGLAAFFLRSKPEPIEVVTPKAVEPAPVAKTTPPPPPEEKKEDPLLREAREAIEAARAKAKGSPDDLDAQLAAWEVAARKAALTPFQREATAALNELREKKAAIKPPPPKEPDKPAVEPAAKLPSAEFKAYLARWESAMARATALDFEGAIADLGRAAVEIPDEAVRKDARTDAELVQQARTLRADGLAALSRLTRGAEVSLHVRSESGERKKIDGTVVRAGNGRAEIRKGEESVWVEADDLAAASLAALSAARKEEDVRAFAVLCLLEGDAEAAARLGGDAVPDRYREYAKGAAARIPKTAPRELEARRRFYAAEREFAKAETMAAAVAKYKSLAEDYADTAVVKSEAPRIRKRTEAGRDYAFVVGGLKGTGTFALAPATRSEVAWVSRANVEGNKETLENYVEAEFAALPDTAYRCWALVAGCCAETFVFYLQTTEGVDVNTKTRQKVSIDPGTEAASTIRPAVPALKKTHEEHKIKGSKTHPKTPARWEWVVIPLPKYSAAGGKKVRLISDQQGFGVAAIVVSSTRTATMSDAELKEEVGRARSLYAAAQEGLVGWWRLDDAAGSPASDSVEGGHPGRLVGSPKPSPGKVGGALKFDTGDEVVVEAAYSFKMITVSAWIRHDVLKPAIQRYVTVGRNEAAVIRCQQGGAQFYIRVGGDISSIVVPNSLEPGKWTHIVGTWDGTTQKLYKDGVVIGSRTPGGKLEGDVSHVTIGSAGEEMKGLIDEVRLYERALSEAELQKQFADGTAGTIAELGVEPPPPPGKPWRPLFDGSTVACLRGTCASWRVENGALAFIPGTNDAAQSREDFSDGELRIRFEVKDAERLWFVFRQGAGGYNVDLTPQLKALEGKPHELIFFGKGDEVTATLDGKPVAVSVTGAAKSGCLQFNAAGKTARILALDTR